jgi:predicted double-glycine peptidase
LWSTHLDKSKESFEWSFYNALTGIGSALTGAFGGLLAMTIGFKPTFLIVAFILFIGSLALIMLKIKFGNIEKVNNIAPLNILNFPELRQTYNYDCGAKATEAVLAYFGMDIREDLIMKKAHTTHAGTPIKGIVKTLISHGLKCKVGKLRIYDVKNYIKKGLPVIMVLQAWTNKKNVNWKKDWIDGHYVVAIGFDEKNIYFEDPSSVLRTYLSHEELKKRWHDVDANGKKYVNYGIVAYAKKGSYHINNIEHMD